MRDSLHIQIVTFCLCMLISVEVTVTLQDDITFSKVFLFEYDALWDGWQAQYGLDLHLDRRWRDLPEQ